MIGAQRCGTTYLHDLLDAHPGIAMARPGRPEPKVFLSDEVAGRGVEWYRRTCFAHAADGELLGEKSTSYIESDAAPARVRPRSATPGSWCSCATRSSGRCPTGGSAAARAGGPAARPRPSAQNLDGPLAWDPERTSVSPYAYLERGRYADYLGPWLAAFPGLVHVQFLEDLVADPDQIGELYAWLGVDAAFRPAELGEPVNESGAPPRTSTTTCGPRLRGVLRRHRPRAGRRCSARRCPWRRRHRPGDDGGKPMTDAHDIRFNRTTVEGRELDYMRESVEGGHTSAADRSQRGRAASSRPRPAPRRCC